MLFPSPLLEAGFVASLHFHGETRALPSALFLSRTVFAAVTVRGVRISAAHSLLAPSAAIGRAVLIIRETEGVDSHASHLCQESLRVPGVRKRLGAPIHKKGICGAHLVAVRFRLALPL
jgi:hypothetical protein